MKNLSIKILFAFVFACVSAGSVWADCPSSVSKIEEIAERVPQYIKNGELKLAMSLSEQLIKAYPECFLPYLQRAKVNTELRKFDDARKDFRKASDLGYYETNPYWEKQVEEKYKPERRNYEARLSLYVAIEAKNKKKYKECVDTLVPVIVDYYKTPAHYVLRAECYQALNQTQYAEDDIKAAFAYARKKNNYDGLLEYANKLIESEPYNPKGYRRRCSVYDGLNKLQLAFDDCSKAVSLDKDSISSNTNYAVIANRMFRYLNAISATETVIKAESNNPNTTLDFEAFYGTLGRFQYLNGDFEDAYKNFEKAIGYEEDKISFGVQKLAAYQRIQEKFNRIPDSNLTEEQIIADEQAIENAEQKYQEKKSAEAVQILNEVIKRRPHWARPIGLRGIYLIPLGQPASSIRDLELALKLEPWQDFLYLHLAKIYEGKDNQKCIQYAHQGIQLNLGSKNKLLEQRAVCSINTGNFAQAHSDFLTIKTGDNKNRAEDTSDKALEIYAQKNGCGEIPGGTINDYYNRAGKFNNESKDYLCAISDTNRALKFPNANKKVIASLRGIAYFNLYGTEAGIRLKTNGTGGYDITAFLFQAMQDKSFGWDSEKASKEQHFEFNKQQAEMKFELAMNHIQSFYERADMLQTAGDQYGWAVGDIPQNDDDMRSNKFICLSNAAGFLFKALNTPKYRKDEKTNKLLNSMLSRIVDARKEYKNFPKIAAEIEKLYQQFTKNYSAIRGADELKKLEQRP